LPLLHLFNVERRVVSVEELIAALFVGSGLKEHSLLSTREPVCFQFVDAHPPSSELREETMKGEPTVEADDGSSPGGPKSASTVAASSTNPPAAAQFKKILRPLFAALALVFIAFSARDLWSRWDEGAAVSVQVVPFVGAFVAAGLAMLLQLEAWRALLLHLTKRPLPRRQAARLYMDSQMARYTPGKVGLAVVRIAGAESVGVAPSVMGGALAIELLSWCGVGSLVGGTLLGLLLRSTELAGFFSVGSLLLSGGAATSLVFLCFIDRRRYPALFHKTFASAGDGPLIPWVMPVWHVAHFLIWIAAGALVGRSVGAPWDVALLIGALLCVAIVGGFLALLAPAGAGVREAIMAWGCAPFLGPAAGLAVGILSRVISLGSDVILFLWFRYRARPKHPEL
jgi:hypothetical protein